MSLEYEYDLVAIGCGPGGQKAVIQAAKLGKKAAIVDTNPLVGGVCLHTGTIPSKSFREAIVHLSGVRERSHYGTAYRVKEQISMEDLTSRCDGIIGDIEQTIRAQFIRNNAEFINGFGTIIDPHHVRVKSGSTEKVLSTRYIVIATGTSPWHPPGFDFDGEVIHDSDSILRMKNIPKTLTVVGGGVIGCEYGSMFATLGTKVTIVEARDGILSFLDRELVDTLVFTLRQQKATVLTNEKVVRCARAPDGRAVTFLESGKRIVSEALLVSAGRTGNVSGMGLDKIGVEADSRGKVKVNEHFQTSIENIYAVGDIIGFPSLASTSLEQGRRAACHAFGLYDKVMELPLPFGIYAIPEIGMVGKTEAELSAAKIPYEVGIGRFGEVERGKIIGDDSGVLKLLFHRSTLQLLGVHIIGENATELVHIGQTVMGLQGGIDFLVQSVFNYPTLAQCYKVAALDGLNKIVATEGLPDEDPYHGLELIL
ncbi:MAG: Si-specific NAD(P)(+) transhydrogenase [Bdellovibrionales bacterium]|nr:Si-specific NAD(P)(+) transhydrogenase [Bdellovibrionales bacterium]